MPDLQAVVDFLQDNYIQLITAGVTFAWIILEIRASIWLWPVGIVLPLLWIYLSWESRFYGNIVVNIYYLITSIVGWILWIRHPKEEGRGQIRTLSLSLSLICLLGAFICFLPMYGLWSNRWEWFDPSSFVGSPLPWADALATVVSFVGMIWLSMKVREHWICWFAANILSALVFFAAQDEVSGYIFIVNTIMSIVGYVHWVRMQRNASHN